MTPAIKKPGLPRMGDNPAQLAARTDRLDGLEMRLGRLESKLDIIIDLTAFLGNAAMRQAIGTAVTTQAMRVNRK
jgi:hypothetical protein